MPPIWVDFNFSFDPANAQTYLKYFKRHKRLKVSSSSQATLTGSRYSCISARNRTLFFMASIMPLFLGFLLSLGCSLFFHSFLLVCFYKLWYLQGLPPWYFMLYPESERFYSCPSKSFISAVYWTLKSLPLDIKMSKRTILSSS